MSSFIRWLHLSDLHIGSDYSPWMDTTLRERMSDLFSKLGDLDFILITGDVIHQGRYNDRNLYTQAKDFIKLLCNNCKKRVVFAIGNHDYERDNARFELLKSWQSLKDFEKKQQEDSFASKLYTNFTKYRDFCLDSTTNDNPISTESYVYNKVDGINIVVLNTSAFSGMPSLNENGEIIKKHDQVLVDDRNKLWINEKNLPNVRELNKQFPTIVVGHHTLQMFENSSRTKLIDFIENLPSRYYFCGHIHKSEERKIGNIQQLASAGLFTDNYNIPIINLYEMHKSKNEHIKSKCYSFQEGDWCEVNYIPNKESELLNIKKQSITNSSNKIKTKDAVRFPYNNGSFNLYLSNANPTDMISPHLHKGIDEVTYVIQGSVYSYINGECKKASLGDSILMPRNKLHAFIPCEYPCEYITIGVESTPFNQYETKWNDDIKEILKLDRELQDCPPDKANEIYISLINYLSSSILEVRWKVIEILKKYLSTDTDDSTYISSKLQELVIDTIRTQDVEKRIFGINMACEFRTSISPNTIRSLMTDFNHFMYAWNCAYYLIQIRNNQQRINYPTLFSKLLEKNEKAEKTITQKICFYYEKIIISLLNLIINHNGELFQKNYLEEIAKQPIANVIPIDDVIIHFVLWCTHSKVTGEHINYSKAKESISDIHLDKKDEILRCLDNVVDYQERYKALDYCKSNKILHIVVKAFFEAIEISDNTDGKTNIIKENIRKYLRVIVSEECNLNCVYCHHEGRIPALIGSKIENNKRFDLREVLIKAKENGFKKIKISGGEPLLFPKVLEICNDFQNDFEDIGFTTNGTQIIPLKPVLEKIKGTRLSFNVSLNSCDAKSYEQITNNNQLEIVKEGIDYLVDNNFKVKINSVITSYNFKEIENLISFAARLKINIKLLDLFSIGNKTEKFQRVSIAEILDKLRELYRLRDEDFKIENDYMCAEVMGIKVLIPKRVYSSNCIYNCKMYPCAEGLFGIRVYEDYSCAYCFNGKTYSGGIEKFNENIMEIRKTLNSFRLTF